MPDMLKSSSYQITYMSPGWFYFFGFQADKGTESVILFYAGWEMLSCGSVNNQLNLPHGLSVKIEWECL